MRVLITGGAGFIGSNAAKRFLDRGGEVIVFDNLSRRGTSKNLEWLKGQRGRLIFKKGDIRKQADIKPLFEDYGKIDMVLHMAAQVAVTTSVVDPREDFDINALGTFNLLEAVRLSKYSPVIINASTNKVYGKMDHAKIKEGGSRYRYTNLPAGASEKEPLSFYSPYGCSKGAAEQYMIDYAGIYGLSTINFRQSCVYGPRQFGVEDQGWVAYFIICAVLNRPITIYGDGKQVRDVLFVSDLVDAFIAASKNLKHTRGNCYNIGGGVSNSISLLEFVGMLEKCLHKKIPLKFADWRPGDQKIYISDTTKAKKDFGWQPKIDSQKGIKLLVEWVSENKDIFDDF